MVGSSGKKNSELKNIKFFKFLIYFSTGFKDFVRDCAVDLSGSDFSESTIQVISILS